MTNEQFVKKIERQLYSEIEECEARLQELVQRSDAATYLKGHISGLRDAIATLNVAMYEGPYWMQTE